MSKIFPKTASSRDIQTKYRSLFDEVMETEEPLIVLNNNKPEVVILSMKKFEALSREKEVYEQGLAQRAVEEYRKEKKNKKLRKLSSLADLS